MSEPYVIVLILSYNGKELLEESITSYLRNEYDNFGLIVIDNGSVDGTKQFVEKNWPEVEVLRTEKNRGYSGGFNFGLEYAFKEKKADYVLISNNDVLADRQVIGELVKVVLLDNRIGFVTGKVYFYEQREMLQSTGFELSDEKRWLFKHRGGKMTDTGQFDNVEELDYADDIFMLVSNRVYEATSGYDTEFEFQAEQFDWQIRAKKLGFLIYYAPNAKIWHKDSVTIGKTSPFKMFYNTRNSYIVRAKHKDKSFMRSFDTWYLMHRVMKPFTKNLAKFNFSMAWAIMRGYLSAMKWRIKTKQV